MLCGFQVRCSLKPSHIVPFNTLSVHEQEECCGRLVACSSPGCDVVLPSAAIAAHEQRCKLVQCQHCQVRLPPEHIASHSSQCEHRFKYSELANQRSIILNVGGSNYRTATSTILKSRWFRENLSDPLSLDRDADGTFFVDRDGRSFRHVLEFLRKGKLVVRPLEGDECGRVLQELLYFGVGSAHELVEAGYAPREAGVSALDLARQGLCATSLCQAGFAPSELLEAGFALDVCELREVGYTAECMNQSGYSAEALKKGGYSIDELIAAKYSEEELISAGYSSDKLR